MLVPVIVVRTVLVCVFVNRPVRVRVLVLVLGGCFVFVAVIGIAVVVLVPVGHSVGVRMGVSVFVFRRHGRRFERVAVPSPRPLLRYGWCCAHGTQR
jgi:hypothetical protein